MAIAIEAFTVVVKKEAITHRYPGGAEAFVMNVPNSTFCADQSLVRLSFPSANQAAAYCDELESLGLSTSDGKDAVICDEYQQQISPECKWLNLGTYKEATIAWVTGEQVRTVVGPKHWDPEKVERNWSGQAPPEMAEDDTTLHEPYHRLFQQAGKLITTHLRHPGEPVSPNSAIALQRGIELLEIIQEKMTANWRVNWLIGKAWHGLGDSNKALHHLRAAALLEKEESAIPRELCGILLELGQVEEASRIAEQALGLDPLNPELLGNLAVAYFLANRLPAAQKTLSVALQQDPTNTINLALKHYFTEVELGRKMLPKDLITLTQELNAS